MAKTNLTAHRGVVDLVSWRAYYSLDEAAHLLGLNATDLLHMHLAHPQRALVVGNLHGLAGGCVIDKVPVPTEDGALPVLPLGLAYVDDDVIRRAADGRPGTVKKAAGTESGRTFIFHFEPAFTVSIADLAMTSDEIARLREVGKLPAPSNQKPLSKRAKLVFAEIENQYGKPPLLPTYPRGGTDPARLSVMKAFSWPPSEFKRPWADASRGLPRV